ncbi:MAG: DNA primase [Gallionella sp.]|nr:DNA primase [Gallionella sp.]MDD4947872.1 DNA primase [Gallionella sp.]MDD5612258.1 DNA primase [Gallionella sp.]
MIPKSFIQDLLNRLDIVDVVERYVPLKKAGANYVACCPFHNEKSPSFTVSQAKQFYHCFGCGAHGTAISFVMEHLGLGFVEAVEELAQSIGMAVQHEQTAVGVASHKAAPDLYEIMQVATRYYFGQLKASRRAIEYLERRGLTGAIAAKFGIGYAPDGWQNLAAAYPDYQRHELEEVGLVISGDDDKRYDRFRDRIMFPIINVRGQVIGFGGRVLDKGEPKYLNSPETVLFEKGRELYGLFQAQKSIRGSQRALVVEGYMDVVALAQHGVEYAVATLGTATTSHHIQKLLRLAEQMVFCFDGDKAGRKAAWRALENALPLLQDGKRINFLFLPAEHDPDSFVREFGREVFEQRVAEAMPLSEYLLEEICSGLDLRSQEARNQLIQRAKPLISAITSPVTALLLRKEVAALAGVTQPELEALYEIAPIVKAPPRAFKKAARASFPVHRVLLQCLLAHPEFGKEMPGDWHDEGEDAEAVMALLSVLREADYAVSGPALAQMFQGTTHARTIAQAEAGMLAWGEEFDVEREFNGLLGKLREDRRLQAFQVMQQEAARGGPSGMSSEQREQYLQLLRRNKDVPGK